MPSVPPHSPLPDPAEIVGASPRAFVEEAPVGTYVSSLSGDSVTAIYVSPRLEAMLGWTGEDWRRPGFAHEFVHTDDRERVIAASRRVRETGERFVEDYRVTAKDGRVVWVHDETVPVRDAEGRVVHLQGYVVDITEARRRGTVHEGQSRVLELIARGAPLEQTLLELARTIEEAGEGVHASVQVLNAERDGFGHCLAPSLPPEATLVLASASIRPEDSPCGLALEQRAPVIVEDVRADDRWPEMKEFVLSLGRRGFWSAPIVSSLGELLGTFALVHAEPRAASQADLDLMGDVAHLAGIAIERAHDEERRRAAEAKYRTLVERLPIGTYVNSFGTSLSPLYVSPQLEKMIGYSLEEWNEPGFLAKLIHPDDRARVLEQVARTHELAEPFSAEYRLTASDGHVVWVHDETVPVFGEDGERLFLQGFMLDVSDRKQLEEQLRHAHKLEAVGRLAGGVAHDFNNLLTAISGYTEFLLARLDEDDPRREDAVEIRRAADRATALTRQLLAFSRRQVLTPQALDLGEAVRGLDGLLGRLLGEHIALSTVTPEEETTIVADASQVEQVLLNLALNARDAMPDGGALTIAVSHIQIGHGSEQHPTLPPGTYVSLAVSDTGTGIDAATRGHLFEPFFTTKEMGKGTGLGLATVYGIVLQSGGDVTVETAPGRGSTFTVLLPEGAGATRAVGGGARGSETVLLVDEHELFRSLAREALTGAGYSVLEAEGPAEALRLADTADRVHVLVAEAAAGGADLAAQLEQRNPALAVVLTTDVGGVPERVDGWTHVLDKPYSPQSLTRTVREALDATGEGTT